MQKWFVILNFVLCIYNIFEIHKQTKNYCFDSYNNETGQGQIVILLVSVVSLIYSMMIFGNAASLFGFYLSEI